MKSNYPFLGKIILSFLLVQFNLHSVSAQALVGYNYDNYIGVNGITSNPASIADSRYKFHFNLLTANVYAGNNGYDFNSNKFYRFQFNNWNNADYQRIINNDKKNGWGNIDILGPSVLVNLNSKSAIGFTTRFRTMMNVYNLSNNAFNLVDTMMPSLYGVNFNESNVKANIASFADVGLTYARVLKDSKTSFLKGGITVKYIQGLGSGTIRIDNLNANIKDINSFQTLNGNASFMYSENIDRARKDSMNFNVNNAFNTANGTIGIDLGFVFEMRSGKFKPKDDNVKSEVRAIPYNLRFSLAVTDFTFSPIRYKPGSQSANYSLTADNTTKDTFNIKDAQTLNDYLAKLQFDNLVSKQAATGVYKVPLPTSIRANIDWHATQKFFLNADALVSSRGAATTQNGTNYISTFTVTPRFETQWLSLYTPISYNVQKEFNWGAGFRLGPLFAGSGSIFSNILKGYFENIDAYVGLSVPLFKNKPAKKKKEQPKTETTTPEKPKSETAKIRDRDKDGVPDDKDECPDVAGLAVFNGCPDTDKDGVPDKNDKCPTIPGSAKYDGCPVPDTDKDGVPDDVDKCPLQIGLITNNGCPEIKSEVRKKVDKAARRIFFRFGNATIDSRSYPALDELVAILKEDKSLFLDIEGHTDDIGKNKRNLTVSQQRADAAKQYLVFKGIEASRITTAGFGATRPVASNKTAKGRAKNRRIVMKIRNN